MNQRPIPRETILLTAAFGLGLAIRLAGLGAAPLTDGEAQIALQAASVASGEAVTVGAQPGYTLLTALLFYILGVTNTIARLIPALAGSLLVLLPWILRRRLGSLAAIICAFALALDPGLVSASRQVGTPVIAAMGLLLAAALWWQRRPAWAGVALGLGLLGGERFWFGAIVLAISWALTGFTRSAGEPGSAKDGRALGLAALITVLAGSGVLLLDLRGLTGLAAGLPTFFSGRRQAGGASIGQVLLGLAAYAPLALLFGVWGAARAATRAQRDPLDLLLGVLALVALLLAAAYPARQVSDLVWALPPLWALAAREMARHVRIPAGQGLAITGMTCLTFVVLGFIALRLLALANLDPANEQVTLNWLTAAGALVLLLLAAALIGWGWYPLVARRGLLAGLALVMGFYTLFALSGASGIRPQPTAELWLVDGRVTQADLLDDSLARVAQYDNPSMQPLPVVVAGADLPSLRWALRAYPGAVFTSRVAADSQPAVVITASEQQPELSAAYRGTPIHWAARPDWAVMTPWELLSWLMYHRAPAAEQSLVLWVRADLFPGGAAVTP
jgi:hypothetical protein